MPAHTHTVVVTCGNALRGMEMSEPEGMSAGRLPCRAAQQRRRSRRRQQVQGPAAGVGICGCMSPARKHAVLAAGRVVWQRTHWWRLTAVLLAASLAAWLVTPRAHHGTMGDAIVLRNGKGVEVHILR